MDNCNVRTKPIASRIAERILNPINNFFNWIYHSEYNPFYRSGTLAIGFLFILLTTGIYLLFFYSVSEPYESMQRIQNQPFSGRWIRALHRYATDAILIAVIFHIFQILSQGKTWGPRTLAWVSGVILFIALYLSAWTGYIMVWDRHGQIVALSGLKLLEAIPFIKNGVSHAFSGKDPLPASFFFMNLFLHVAIPLGMFFGIWIHTAKLTRAKWFPDKKIFKYSIIGFLSLSLIYPAKLLDKADLLNVVGKARIDWWYNFWMPFISDSNSLLILIIATMFVLTLAIVPWVIKPKSKENFPVSKVDIDNCNGCKQCVLDCPYGAINMIKHPNGKHLLAEVSSNFCVSCAVCTASCEDLAIGPPGRSGKDQISMIENFITHNLLNINEQSIILIGCNQNNKLVSILREISINQKDIYCIDFNCCATIHHLTLEKFLNYVGGIILIGCPKRNCVNRDGLDLLAGRLYEKRVPFISRDIDKNRIIVTSLSEIESNEIRAKLKILKTYLQTKSTNLEPKKSLNLAWCTKRAIASTLLIAGIGIVSQASSGATPQHGIIRISTRLPSLTKSNCRLPTEDELRNSPKHMMQKEICVQNKINYNFRVKINNKDLFSKQIEGKSIRGDSPVLINEDIRVRPGRHNILVEITPTKNHGSSYKFNKNLLINKGKIKLISILEEKNTN